MKVVSVILAVALAAPLLIVAVALGPVILGIMCAIGCAMLIAALGNLAIGLGLFGRCVERARMRHARHAPAARRNR